jgi:hypothetical protein
MHAEHHHAGVGGYACRASSRQRGGMTMRRQVWLRSLSRATHAKNCHAGAAARAYDVQADRSRPLELRKLRIGTWPPPARTTSAAYYSELSSPSLSLCLAIGSITGVKSCRPCKPSKPTRLNRLILSWFVETVQTQQNRGCTGLAGTETSDEV